MGADFYGSTILVSGCGSWRASGLSFRLTWSETTMLSAGNVIEASGTYVLRYLVVS